MACYLRAALTELNLLFNSTVPTLLTVATIAKAITSCNQPVLDRSGSRFIFQKSPKQSHARLPIEQDATSRLDRVLVG